MVDPATGAPTVALVSPYYRKGNILEVKATKPQKVRWVSTTVQVLAFRSES